MPFFRKERILNAGFRKDGYLIRIDGTWRSESLRCCIGRGLRNCQDME